MHRLPPTFMSMCMAEELGTTLGKFVTADCDRDSSCVGDYMRIKVGIDVYQPLRKGIQVCLPTSEEGFDWCSSSV